MNAHREFATVPKNFDFDANNGFFKTPSGKVMSSRLKVNYLPSEMQSQIAVLNKEQLAQLDKDGFYSKNLLNKQDYLYKTFNIGSPLPVPEEYPIQEPPSEEPIPEPEPEPTPEPEPEPEPEPTPEPEPEPEPQPKPQPRPQPKPQPKPQPQPPQVYQRTIYTKDAILIKDNFDRHGLIGTYQTTTGSFKIEKRVWDNLPKGMSLQQFYDEIKKAGFQQELSTRLSGVAWGANGDINGGNLQETLVKQMDYLITQSAKYGQRGLQFRSLDGRTVYAHDPQLVFDSRDRAILSTMVRGNLNPNWKLPYGSVIRMRTDAYQNPQIQIWINNPKRGGFGKQADATIKDFSPQEKIVFNKLFKGILISYDPYYQLDPKFKNIPESQMHLQSHPVYNLYNKYRARK